MQPDPQRQHWQSRLQLTLDDGLAQQGLSTAETDWFLINTPRDAWLQTEDVADMMGALSHQLCGARHSTDGSDLHRMPMGGAASPWQQLSPLALQPGVALCNGMSPCMSPLPDFGAYNAPSPLWPSFATPAAAPAAPGGLEAPLPSPALIGYCSDACATPSSPLSLLFAQLMPDGTQAERASTDRRHSCVMDLSSVGRPCPSSPTHRRRVTTRSSGGRRSGASTTSSGDTHDHSLHAAQLHSHAQSAPSSLAFLTCAATAAQTAAPAVDDAAALAPDSLLAMSHAASVEGAQRAVAEASVTRSISASLKRRAAELATAGGSSHAFSHASTASASSSDSSKEAPVAKPPQQIGRHMEAMLPRVKKVMAKTLMEAFPVTLLESLVSRVVAKGRGGRRPGTNPCLDPNMDPAKAMRLIANRRSAARSKFKRRLVFESLSVRRDVLTEQRAQVQAEMKELEKLTKQMEARNAEITRRIQLILTEPQPLPSLVSHLKERDRSALADDQTPAVATTVATSAARPPLLTLQPSTLHNNPPDSFSCRSSLVRSLSSRGSSASPFSGVCFASLQQQRGSSDGGFPTIRRLATAGGRSPQGAAFAEGDDGSSGGGAAPRFVWQQYHWDATGRVSEPVVASEVGGGDTIMAPSDE